MHYLNLINHQPDVNKIYLYARDPYIEIQQLLIKKCESVWHYNDSSAFIKQSNEMDDVYEIIEEYNLNEELKLLIVFNFMIADRLSK